MKLRNISPKNLTNFGCRGELILPILTLIGTHTHTLGLTKFF